MAANGETTGYSATSITTFGAYPDTEYEAWAKSAGDNPSVIKFELAPLSDLMTIHDFPDQEDIDTIRQFFVDGVNNYCSTMLGEPCQVQEGCGLTYSCSSGYSCVDDPNAEEKHVCKPLCSCNAPGDPANNGYQCTDNTSGYCSSDQLCQSNVFWNKGDFGEACIERPEVTCRCRNPGSIGDNSYTCEDGTSGDCATTELCYESTFLKRNVATSCRSKTGKC